MTLLIKDFVQKNLALASLFKKHYIYNIFATLLQQIPCGKLLLVLI